MSTLKILGKTVKYGLLNEVNWATPLDATAAYKTQIWEKNNTIPDGDEFIDEANESGQYGIHEEAEMFTVDAVSGLPKINFTSRVAKILLIDYLVAAMQGIVTETILTPFDKSVACGGLVGPIDFRGDAGHIFGVVIDNGNADDGMILQHAILNTLKFSIDMNARGVARNLQMEGEWIGNALLREQTLSGIPVAKPTSGYYNDADVFGASVFTINGVDYSGECIKKFELEIDNKAASDCKTSGGKADQYDITPSYIVRLFLDYSAITEKIPKQYGAGGQVVLTFNNDVLADTDGELGFIIPSAYLTKNPYEFNGEFLAVVVEAKIKSLAGASPFTVNITDGVLAGL